MSRRLRLGLPKGSLQQTTQRLFTQAGFALRIPDLHCVTMFAFGSSST